jgi:chemotaxis protein methyltransferase CheR
MVLAQGFVPGRAITGVPHRPGDRGGSDRGAGSRDGERRPREAMVAERAVPELPPPLCGRESEISPREYELFQALVYEHTGITLGPHKRHLVQARLGRRLRALGLATFTEYRNYLVHDDPGGVELGRFINAITTNKTDFFREPHHFTYLAAHWIPAVKARAARDGNRTLRIWSAGCSTGEEPYTIAITLREALGPAAGWDVKILASDLDTDVLARAQRGVYTTEQTAPVPPDVLARYFLRGRGDSAGHLRVRPELSSLITFRRINLMDARWPIRSRLDAVFCRNTLIYFDAPTQQRMLERFLGLLKEDGLLILGHSESVHGLLDRVARLGHTIFRKNPAGERTAGGAPA